MKFKSVAVTTIQFVIVLFLVTFGITLLVRLLPGDPVSTLMPFATEETRLELSKELGLDANASPHVHNGLANFFVIDVAIVGAVECKFKTVGVASVGQQLPGTISVGGGYSV